MNQVGVPGLPNRHPYFVRMLDQKTGDGLEIVGDLVEGVQPHFAKIGHIIPQPTISCEYN